MKRTYADLHLCPNLKNPKQTENMIKKSRKLGYHLIAIPLPLSSVEEEVEWLRRMCKEAKIDFVSRVDLKPKTSRELLKDLRGLRRKVEIIAVTCESKQVARQAAKDHRVDILSFPTELRKRFFDRAEAELASKTTVSLEVDVKPLITLKGKPRIRLLSALRRETAIAKSFQVPVILSSGATEESLMRKPRELAALASLFDMDASSAIEATSSNPTSIVKRNRSKLSSNFVAPGIRIVRRGKDC